MRSENVAVASGVYKIVNGLDGKCYVGSAVRLAVRLRHHRNALIRGEHRSVLLQRAWNKHGAEAFSFSPLLVCAKENLLMYEQICIDGMKPAYNICKVAGSRLGAKYSEESRALLSRIRSAKPRSPKQLEHLRNLAAAKRGVAGPKHSDVTKAKIAALRTGTRHRPETIEKIAVANTGRLHSEDTRAKISASKVGQKRQPFSAEWRAKLGAASAGHTLSPESRAKLSDSMRAAHQRRRALRGGS